MSETNKFQNVVRFGSLASAAAIAAVILSSSFLGNALAADNAATMPMASMEMHKSMMSGMKGMESMKGSGDIDHDFCDDDEDASPKRPGHGQYPASTAITFMPECGRSCDAASSTPRTYARTDVAAVRLGIRFWWAR